VDVKADMALMVMEVWWRGCGSMGGEIVRFKRRSKQTWCLGEYSVTFGEWFCF